MLRLGWPTNFSGWNKRFSCSVKHAFTIPCVLCSRSLCFAILCTTFVQFVARLPRWLTKLFWSIVQILVVSLAASFVVSTVFSWSVRLCCTIQLHTNPWLCDELLRSSSCCNWPKYRPIFGLVQTLFHSFVLLFFSSKSFAFVFTFILTLDGLFGAVYCFRSYFGWWISDIFV